MEDVSIKICPKCQQPIEPNFYDHYRTFCLQKSSISKLSEKVALFQDHTCVCGRCLNIFTKQKWQYHQKKIRTHCTGFTGVNARRSTPVKSFTLNDDILSQRMLSQPSQKNYYSYSRQKQGDRLQASSISQSRLFSNSFFSDRHTHSQKITYTKQISEDETILLLLLNLLDAKSKIPLLDWVKRNKRIKSIYLQQFFERFLEKTFRRLWEVIRIPTFQLLQEKASLKWRQILKDPQDIFNQEIILDYVKNMSSAKRNRILSAINRLYKSYYADVFPKFNVEVTEVQSKRVQFPLRTIDLFKLLEQLFATKQKDLIHIGIDLYLIFQSAQRITSDKINITKGIQQLLIDRKSNKDLCQLEMDIRKTRKSGKFILSEQLCQLLQLFQWKGFYQNGRIYQRMKKIFGFPVYSIKKCIFAEFELQKAKHSNLNLQSLANHSNIQVSLGYARDGVQINEKFIKDQLRIPNLRICPISRDHLFKFIGKRLQFKKYAQINHDWLEKLKQKLHNYNQTFCDYYNEVNTKVDYHGNIIFQQFQQHIEDQSIKDNKPQISVSLLNNQKQDIEKERVDIQNLEYSFKDSKFKFNQLFTQTTVTYCQGCNLQFFDHPVQGQSCIICNGQYHSICLQKFCSCVRPSYQHTSQGIPSNCERYNNKLQLKMPSQYLENKNQQKLDQIIFLLAARRFRFTATATYEGNLHIDEEMVKKCNVDRITLSHYQQYQRGSYFPPIILGLSGQRTTSGAGFGLFAAQDIQRYCFIGQYSADILSGSDSIYIKRIDSVFTLVEGTRPANSILIAPFRRCGYVCLINGVREEEANCSTQKVQINGFLRVVIFTNKKIKKGMELCYNYDQNSRFTKRDLALQIQSQKILTLPSSSKRCGLANLGATCYLNATLQLFRVLFEEDLFNNQETQIQQLIYQILIQLKKQQQYYNPKVYIKLILDFINSKTENPRQKFSLIEQADAHQFLLKIMNEIGNNLRKKLTGSTKSVLTCNKCASQSINQENFLTLSVEVQDSLSIENILHQPYQQNVQYRCEICSHKRHKKSVQVTKLPDVLVVTLKRFDSSLQKIGNKIQIGKMYKTQQYALQSIIVHKGQSFQTGHYITCQYIDNFIRIFDDKSVELTEDSSLPNDGYIFGYKKMIL